MKLIQDDEDKFVLLYISGPMTGLPGKNYDAFHNAAGQLREEGWKVVSPAELNPYPEEAGEWVDFMRNDIKALVDCHAIYMLPGWSKSKGSSLEHTIARSLGLRVIYRTTD